MFVFIGIMNRFCFILHLNTFDKISNLCTFNLAYNWVLVYIHQSIDRPPTLLLWSSEGEFIIRPRPLLFPLSICSITDRPPFVLI